MIFNCLVLIECAEKPGQMIGCTACLLEVDLLDDAELLVGDHEGEHHDHADQDQEGEQHAGQVADDPDTASNNLKPASCQYPASPGVPAPAGWLLDWPGHQVASLRVQVGQLEGALGILSTHTDSQTCEPCLTMFGAESTYMPAVITAK